MTMYPIQYNGIKTAKMFEEKIVFILKKMILEKTEIKYV